jgi:pyruvate/2-oxoglutarate dehydrogenase complex dihydrolipoamide dehydrogenase (E3) component
MNEVDVHHVVVVVVGAGYIAVELAGIVYNPY